MRAAFRIPAVLMTLVIGTAGVTSCAADDAPGTTASERPKAASTRSGQAGEGTAGERTAGERTAGERTAPQVADLPKHAVTSDKKPNFGAADTMASGYTGEDFLATLSKRWKLELDKPVEQEMPDGKKRTYVHGRAEDGASVSAGYSDHRNLSSLLCRTGTERDTALDFLDSCTGLDVPGVDHAGARSWLRQAKKETDSLYGKKVAETGNKKEYVISGVYSSGPVTMVLHRAYDKYSLRILGGAVA
ncbi:hypothetical protein [Streptomyces sp. NBC_01185]|uniref:hypothetical protein n=1 Tax=Streptomyces sp. NBC_01185 TaxID=2903764 RepID=UPI003869CDFC|nr:hypothetical protein OG770_07900 [Streptomyces sp. NBC_01185]